MTQSPFPPGTAFPDPMHPPQRSNGWAIASLICGIIGCFPVLQLLAIVFGLVGIRASRRVHTGKGMAIAGLVLGILFTLGWAGCTAGGTVLWVSGKPVRSVSNRFLLNAAAGQTDAALADCTSSITADQIKAFANAAASHGAVKDATTINFFGHTTSSGTTFDAVGVVTFADNQNISAQLRFTSIADTYKVTMFQPRTSSSMATSAPAATNSAQPSQTP